jgi:hypothetical protein
MRGGVALPVAACNAASGGSDNGPAPLSATDGGTTGGEGGVATEHDEGGTNGLLGRGAGGSTGGARGLPEGTF